MSDPDLAPTGRGRARVLATALHLFTEQGFDRTTTRDIGRAAGISSPALYRHYASMDDLGRDLYRRCYRVMVDAVRAAAQGADGPLARLAAYATALAALYEREPLTVLFVDEHQLRFWPQLRAEFEPDTLSAMVTRWVAAGRGDGTLGTDVEAAAQVALVMGLTSQWCAMRRAGLASAASAASLPVLLRRALTRAPEQEDST
jgi:AcrR family transcriptional regulator